MWARDAVINVLAPGADQPRTVPREPERTYEVALAAGRLATRTGGGLEDPTTFQVDDRKVDGQRTPYGWAFDGTRLAWAAEPCGNPVIQVWDLATDPPPPANDRCIRARLVRRREARPQGRGGHRSPQLPADPRAGLRGRGRRRPVRGSPARSHRRTGGNTGSAAGETGDEAAPRRALTAACAATRGSSRA